MPPEDEFLFLRHGGNLHHMRKTRWGESLTSIYSQHPSHHHRSNQSWKEFAFYVCGVSFSLGDQFPSAWLWYLSPRRDGYHPENGSY